MALVGLDLGATIRSEIIAIEGAPTDDVLLTKICNAIGKAIVEYITANAIVNTTMTTGQVTSGQGSGGIVIGPSIGTVS